MGAVIDEFFNLPTLIASLSGATIYTLIQDDFLGIDKVLAFFSSFIMGIIGGDITMDLFKRTFSIENIGDGVLGSFLCSVLVVTISVKIISYVKDIYKKK